MSKRLKNLDASITALVAGMEKSSGPGSQDLRKEPPPLAVPIATAVRQTSENAWARAKNVEEEMLALKASGLVVVELDPSQIDDSAYRDRHGLALQGASFEELKESIRRHGQFSPIIVRPKTGAPDRFEVAFGHRRRHACQDLGIKVQARVLNVDDYRLVIMMEVENSKRRDLSAFEIGRKFNAWIDSGLLNQTRISEEFGYSKSLVSQYIGLRAVPDEIWDAIGDPLAIPLRRARDLAIAMKDSQKRAWALANADEIGRSSLSRDQRLVAFSRATIERKSSKGPTFAEHRDENGKRIASLERTPSATILKLPAGLTDGEMERLWGTALELVNAGKAPSP